MLWFWLFDSHLKTALSIGNWIELESTPRSQYGPLNQPITGNVVPERYNKGSWTYLFICPQYQGQSWSFSVVSLEVSPIVSGIFGFLLGGTVIKKCQNVITQLERKTNVECHFFIRRGFSFSVLSKCTPPGGRFVQSPLSIRRSIILTAVSWFETSFLSKVQKKKNNYNNN